MKEVFNFRDWPYNHGQIFVLVFSSSSTHKLVMKINKICGLLWIIRRYLNPIHLGFLISFTPNTIWLLLCPAFETLHAFAFPLFHFHLFSFILWTIFRSILGLLAVIKNFIFYRDDHRLIMTFNSLEQIFFLWFNLIPFGIIWRVAFFIWHLSRNLLCKSAVFTYKWCM